MIVAILRSRVRNEALDEYTECLARMRALAISMPGFISVKGFYSEDGEKVAIHQWESAEHLRKWMEHPEHLEAQQRGREHFYQEYSVCVMEDPLVKQFKRPDASES